MTDNNTEAKNEPIELEPADCEPTESDPTSEKIYRSIHIRRTTNEALSWYAKRENRSLNSLLTHLLEGYVEAIVLPVKRQEEALEQLANQDLQIDSSTLRGEEGPRPQDTDAPPNPLGLR